MRNSSFDDPWEKEEMRYWERKYSFRGNLFRPSYRIFEREKFLLRWVKRSIQNKTLIEIGCCFPYSIILVLNPSWYKYTYVGVDVVKHALRTAKNYMPDGMFVRCSATKLPFRTTCFDVILSLGVIHHLFGGSENIRELSKFLRKGGLFVLTEAVERKTLSILGKLVDESSSPHEGTLKSQRLMQTCWKSGKIVHFHRNNSVVLGLFCRLIDFFPILQENKTYLRFITALDKLTIKTLGRISSLFDAGAYFIIFKKI